MRKKLVVILGVLVLCVGAIALGRFSAMPPSVQVTIVNQTNRYMTVQSGYDGLYTSNRHDFDRTVAPQATNPSTWHPKNFNSTLYVGMTEQLLPIETREIDGEIHIFFPPRPDPVESFTTPLCWRARLGKRGGFQLLANDYFVVRAYHERTLFSTNITLYILEP